MKKKKMPKWLPNPLLIQLLGVILFSVVLINPGFSGPLELVHFKSYAEILGSSAADSDSSPDLFPIWGHLGRPEGKGPFPAVILMHGCGGIRPPHFQWAGILNELGYVTLTIDSFRPRNTLRVCNNFARVTSPPQRALDAYGGLSFLQSQAYVIPDRVGVIGWSHGGIAVLHAVNRSGVSARFKQQFKAAATFYPWCMTDRSFEIPLLILIGESDNWTPAELCESLSDHSKNAVSGIPLELVVYPNAHHSFDDPQVKIPYLLEDALGKKRLLKYDQDAHLDSIKRIEIFLEKNLAE